MSMLQRMGVEVDTFASGSGGSAGSNVRESDSRNSLKFLVRSAWAVAGSA